MSAILDWYGCATFRLTLDDLVVFLDAYIDRVPGAPGTGLRADDIDRADWIVVGHSHFDHLWGAERIARQTGATDHRLLRERPGHDRSQGVPAEQLMRRVRRRAHPAVRRTWWCRSFPPCTPACGPTKPWGSPTRSASATSA